MQRVVHSVHHLDVDAMNDDVDRRSVAKVVVVNAPACKIDAVVDSVAEIVESARVTSFWSVLTDLAAPLPASAPTEDRRPLLCFRPSVPGGSFRSLRQEGET